MMGTDFLRIYEMENFSMIILGAGTGIFQHEITDGGGADIFPRSKLEVASH